MADASVNWPRAEAFAMDEERIIRFRPAWHKCDPDPHKDRGIHGVEMFWILRTGLWAVDWMVYTQWGLPDAEFHLVRCTHPAHQGSWPSTGEAMGAGITIHSPVPLYEDQSPNPVCPITEASCYTDSSFALGNIWFELLRAKGDEIVWQQMREFLQEYRKKFDG